MEIQAVVITEAVVVDVAVDVSLGWVGDTVTLWISELDDEWNA